MDARWKVALARAEDHHGLVTRRRVLAAGLSEEQVDRAVADGLLCVVASGVYRVRGAPQTERMAIAAAVLAAGGGASFATAGSLLRLETPLHAVPVDVSVENDRVHPRVRRVEVETTSRSFHPVAVHRCRAVDGSRVTVDGIVCSDPARTLLDLATRLRVDELGDAVERALRLGLINPAVLARRFEQLGGQGRKGAANVREVLAQTRPGPLDSKLEGRAWRMLLRSPLAEPRRQLWVQVAGGQWYRIDFAWPELLLAVETEGFEWHSGRARWKADRLRVAALERLGWRVLVVTWDDVVLRTAETLERIATVLAERRALSRVV